MYIIKVTKYIIRYKNSFKEGIFLRDMFYAERKTELKKEVPLYKRDVYITTRDLSCSGVCFPTVMSVPESMVDFHKIIRKNSKKWPHLENKFLETDDKLLLVMKEDTRLAGVDEFGNISLQLPRPYEYGGGGSWGGKIELGIGVETYTLRRSDLRANLGSLDYWEGKSIFDLNEVAKKEGFPITLIGLSFKRYFKRTKDEKPETEDLDFEWAFEKGNLIGNMYRFSIDHSSIGEPHSVKEREPVFIKGESMRDGFFGCYAVNRGTGNTTNYEEIVSRLTKKDEARKFLKELCESKVGGLKGLMEILIGRVVPDLIEEIRFK